MTAGIAGYRSVSDSDELFKITGALQIKSVTNDSVLKSKTLISTSGVKLSANKSDNLGRVLEDEELTRLCCV